jgi:hypothetical protein
MPFLFLLHFFSEMPGFLESLKTEDDFCYIASEYRNRQEEKHGYR